MIDAWLCVMGSTTCAMEKPMAVPICSPAVFSAGRGRDARNPMANPTKNSRRARTDSARTLSKRTTGTWADGTAPTDAAVRSTAPR